MIEVEVHNKLVLQPTLSLDTIDACHQKAFLANKYGHWGWLMQLAGTAA